MKFSEHIPDQMESKRFIQCSAIGSLSLERVAGGTKLSFPEISMFRSGKGGGGDGGGGGTTPKAGDSLSSILLSFIS